MVHIWAEQVLPLQLVLGASETAYTTSLLISGLKAQNRLCLSKLQLLESNQKCSVQLRSEYPNLPPSFQCLSRFLYPRGCSSQPALASKMALIGSTEQPVFPQDSSSWKQSEQIMAILPTHSIRNSNYPVGKTIYELTSLRAYSQTKGA